MLRCFNSGLLTNQVTYNLTEGFLFANQVIIIKKICIIQSFCGSTGKSYLLHWFNPNLDPVSETGVSTDLTLYQPIGKF